MDCLTQTYVLRAASEEAGPWAGEGAGRLAQWTAVYRRSSSHTMISVAGQHVTENVCETGASRRETGRERGSWALERGRGRGRGGERRQGLSPTPSVPVRAHVREGRSAQTRSAACRFYAFARSTRVCAPNLATSTIRQYIMNVKSLTSTTTSLLLSPSPSPSPFACHASST